MNIPTIRKPRILPTAIVLTAIIMIVGCTFSYRKDGWHGVTINCAWVAGMLLAQYLLAWVLSRVTRE